MFGLCSEQYKKHGRVEELEKPYGRIVRTIRNGSWDLKTLNWNSAFVQLGDLLPLENRERVYIALLYTRPKTYMHTYIKRDAYAEYPRNIFEYNLSHD